MKEELQLAKDEIVDLEKKLHETDKSNSMSNNYLAHEIEKIKQSKAQLRCDNLQLQKKCQRLMDEKSYLEANQKSVTENKAF